MGAGLVDIDHRVEVGVVLFNCAFDDFHVREGDYITQLILVIISSPAMEEVKEYDGTSMGASGFGSMGVEALQGQSLIVRRNSGSQLIN